MGIFPIPIGDTQLNSKFVNSFVSCTDANENLKYLFDLFLNLVSSIKKKYFISIINIWPPYTGTSKYIHCHFENNWDNPQKHYTECDPSLYMIHEQI